MFTLGDIVRLKNGTSPLEIMDIYRGGQYASAKYLHSDNWQERPIKDYVLYENEIEEKEMSKQLYEWTKDNVKVYGTKLAVDSEGNCVMEVSGGGGLVAMAPDTIQKVMPYTVDVEFVGNAYSESRTYSYKFKKDLLNVGDFLIIESPSGFAIVKVVGVDTKSTKATKELSVVGRIPFDKVE